MEDSEAIFAMKVCLAVNRVDFWRIKDDFSPYEWTLLRAMSVVQPWGDERADLRSAINNMRLIASHGVRVDDDIFNSMRFYLKINEEKPRNVSPEELANLLKVRHGV